MITLDSALTAVQESQTRSPLCRILSCENVDAIPFNGEFLSTATVNEQHPAVAIHSTDRLFGAYAVGPDNTNHYYLRYIYTDTDRTYFTVVDFDLGAYHVAGEVSVCELADGSIGLIWIETASGTTYVKYRNITVAGENLDPAVTGTIFAQASTAFLSGPFVVTLSDDTYLMVYGAQDGDSHYHLYRRTSADFVTWSAASEISLSDLDDTLRKANPSILILTTGELWLFFDYLESVGPNGEELTNVYYFTSTDKFATASAPAALTSYPTYDTRAEHPVAVQKTATDIYLVFDKIMASLHIDKDTTGWRASSSPISNIHIDVAAQKLYVISSRMGVGAKTLFCVTKIDLTTWTIDKCWDNTSPDYLTNTGGTYWDSYRGDGAYIVVGHQSGVVSVLDTIADTITTYAFYDLYSYGIPLNVDWTPVTREGNTVTGMILAKAWLDATAMRLYVTLVRSYVYNCGLQIGYIDLTETPGEGENYTFNDIVAVASSGGEEEVKMTGLKAGAGFVEINTAADLIIVGMEGTVSSRSKGGLRVYTLSTGGLWKDYDVDSNPTFPYRGLGRGIYNATTGKIAGTFEYQPLYGQADYRGLCLIDLTTDIITYARPPWASVDDYNLRDIALTDDGYYLIAAYGYGIALFDGSATWTLYDNDTLPGLTPSGDEDFMNPVIYNPTTRMIIAGCGNAYTSSWSGVIMFSRDGYLKQANYKIGTYDSGWTWGTISNLVQGYTDYEAFVCVDPDDAGLYCFWTNQTGAELSIKWDKEMPAFDLSPYLLRGSSVKRQAFIDVSSGNWDASLSFEVSHGHLFDTSNVSSLLKQYLAKGRKLQQQFGETVAGVDYWEPARDFACSYDGEVKYQRGDYPAIQVEAETPRKRWEQIHIAASEYYDEAYPEEIITDLLTSYAGIASASISLGEWDGRAEVSYQFVDVSLADAVDQIAYHFGYAIRDGAAGIIDAVKITDAGIVDVAYATNAQIVNATPNNKYSSFTNRWIVECEEATFTELLMAEELAAELNASHRWNTGTKTYRVNYTQGDKIYRNPRLEVVQSVESLAFELAGDCDEELLDNSHDEADQTLWDTYCEIEVSSPDLTPAFIAALAGLVGAYFLPDLVSGAHTKRIGSYLTALFTFVALNILGATGNFYYRVYGQPVVKVRRQLSAQSNDPISQTKMGQVIAGQAYQDPLCGSAVDCQTVADFRKMVGMGERARWQCEKVPDLRVEDGDTISVPHPFSGDAVTLFITDLSITFQMPESAGDSGEYQQTIEGWRR